MEQEKPLIIESLNQLFDLNLDPETHRKAFVQLVKKIGPETVIGQAKDMGFDTQSLAKINVEVADIIKGNERQGSKE